MVKACEDPQVLAYTKALSDIRGKSFGFKNRSANPPYNLTTYETR